MEVLGDESEKKAFFFSRYRKSWLNGRVATGWVGAIANGDRSRTYSREERSLLLLSATFEKKFPPYQSL